MAHVMESESLLITRLNVHKLKGTNFASLNKYWHKFILENGGLFDKEDVLEAMLYSVHPFYLVPVKYTVVGKDAFFIARNCGPAIEKFCLNSLSPINLKNHGEKIILSIQTCYILIDDFQLNMQDHIKKAILKRLESSPQGCIDLSAFHKEPELYEIIYCPLSITRFLMYILAILKRMVVVDALILSNNGLENVIPLEILHEFNLLSRLDLSHNKIKDLQFIEEIGQVMHNLQEINLNGNPICSCFRTGLEYTRCIKKSIPSLLKLDGITLFNGIPSHQAWLCCGKASGVVNEFLKHYFILYDKERQVLEHTYDENAIFSMTCNQLSSQNIKAYQLECYQTYSKHLLKVNDQNKILGISHHKNTNIAKVLCDLPSTEHDPYSFKVDVLLFQESCIILVVSGVFKDFQDEPRCRSFNRTFVLKKVARDEYKIANDLYHVTDATEDQVLDSFLHSKVSENENKRRLFVNKEEEENLVGLVENLTKMNSDYSRKCLQDCGWNVIKSLEVFLENYHNVNISPEAFIK